MNDMIEKLVLDLARARLACKQHASEIIYAEAVLADMPIGKVLSNAQADLEAAKQEAKATDAALREATLANYAAHGDKHPHKAVTVKDFIVLEYDVTDAIEVAIKNYSLHFMLKLDKRKFNTIAKEADFPFVTKHTDPRVSVARDLTSYLEAWEASVQDKADLTQAKAEANFVAELSDELAKKGVLGVAK